MIITIGNTKGGVGKSIISAHLAVAATSQGKHTLLIDADPQGSCMAFRAVRVRDDLTAVSITVPTIHKDVASFQGYDLIIIDAGGRDGKSFRSAIAAADLLVIPVLPSAYDVWATEDTIEVLREVRAYKDLPAQILFNQTRETVMGRETREALNDYSADVKVLKSTLRYHEYYKKSVAVGTGITEYRPGSVPAKDICSVLSEILTLRPRR